MSPSRAPRASLVGLWSLAAVVSLGGCSEVDPALRARRAERDQLRREVVGFRGLEPVASSGLMLSDREVVVSVSDTLIRALLDASFPVTVPIPGGFTVTLESATVAFGGNVARVDLSGQLRRASFPRVAAAVSLRGALDAFEVDSARVLGARMTIDDAMVGTPSGVPRVLDQPAILLLQRVVERGIPALVAVIPAIAIPVRVDREMVLPAFGERAALQVAEVRAPLTVTAARVIAFQNRLWFILRVERGAFVVAGSAPAAGSGSSP